MIKRCARFVVRDNQFNGQEGPVDVIIGAAFRDQKFFKPERVYEATEIDGELVIKDIGASTILGIGEKTDVHRFTTLCYS